MKQPDPIDITGLDRPMLLASLYNHAVEFNGAGAGPSFQPDLHMTTVQARALIANRRGQGDLHFDCDDVVMHPATSHLSPIPLKVDMGPDKLHTGAYDEYRGAGAAAHAVQAVRDGRDLPAADFRTIQIASNRAARQQAMDEEGRAFAQAHQGPPRPVSLALKSAPLKGPA